MHEPEIIPLYVKRHVGSLVCLSRHKGALGFDWFDVGDCPPGSKPPPAVLAEFAAMPHKPPPSDSASTGNAADPKPSASPAAPQYYPERALSAGKDGRAVVRCDVINGSTLADCRVQSEDPPGLGFGAAAIQGVMASEGSVKPEELKGRTQVDAPVLFKLSR